MKLLQQRILKIGMFHILVYGELDLVVLINLLGLTIKLGIGGSIES